MRIILTILVLTLFLSCSNKKLDGFWFGSVKVDLGRYPSLIRFENDELFDYFSMENLVYHDTIKYRYFWNKLNTTNSQYKRKQYKIYLNKTELSFFDSKSDTLNIIYNKKKEDNFVFDFLNDKSLLIDLPTGNGLVRTVGRSHRFDNPLYLLYKNNKLKANFLDTTLSVENNFLEFLRNKMKTMRMDLYYNWERSSVSLIADKNIRNSDLNLLRKQLKIAGFARVDYFLKSNSYDKFNIFSSKLKDLSEEELSKYNVPIDSLLESITMPSIYETVSNFKDKLLLVEIDKNVIKLSDSIISDKEFKNLITPSKLPGNNLLILYYLTENSVYQDFIHFYDLILNSYYDERDDYLMKKYGVKFRDGNVISRKEIRDANINIPLFLSQLDKEEYEKIKYQL